MSVEATAWAWKQTPGLSRSESLVLLALADHADATGECYPGRARLAEMCGFDVSEPHRKHSMHSITRLIRALEKKELVKRTPRHRPETGSRSSTLYLLSVEATPLGEIAKGEGRDCQGGGGTTAKAPYAPVPRLEPSSRTTRGTVNEVEPRLKPKKPSEKPSLSPYDAGTIEVEV